MFLLKRYISSVHSLSHGWLFATPWTAARQAFLSAMNSRSLLKLMSIESVMPSNRPILCCPLLLLPSLFPNIRVATHFPVSHFFASGGLSIEASASTSVLPMNIQGWFPLGLTGLISLQSKDSQESSPTPQFNIYNIFIYVWLVAQSCLTLCDPMDCSPPGSSVNGISQARILEWVAISFSRGSLQPRDLTHVSCIFCIAGSFFFFFFLTIWATREALFKKIPTAHPQSQYILWVDFTGVHSFSWPWDSFCASCSEPRPHARRRDLNPMDVLWALLQFLPWKQNL